MVYYLLNDNLILKSQKNQFRRIIDRATWNEAEVSPRLFEFLKKCNGCNALEETKEYKILEKKGFIRKIKNPLHSPTDRITEGKIHLKRRIEMAFLCVTGRCNLHCKHCYFSPHRKDKEMKLSQIKKIIDKLHEAGVYKVCITGGEPSIRRDLEEICRYLSKKGFVFRMNSNGTLLNQKRLDSLIATGLRRVQFSVEGISRKSHEAFRRKDFNKTWRNLKILSKYRRKGKIDFFSISTMLMKENLNELNAMYEKLVNEIQPDNWYLERPLACGSYSTHSDKYAVTVDEVEPYLYTLIKKVKQNKPTRPGRIFFDKYYDWMNPKVYDFRKKFYTPFSRKSYACGNHFEHMYIMQDGAVVICWHTDVFPFYAGDFKKESLDKIWNGRLENFKSKFRLEDMDCAECKFLKTCGSGCRAAAILNTKDLFGCDTDCKRYIEKGNQRDFF